MTRQGSLSEFITARLGANERATLAALARLERVSLSEALRRSIVLAGDMALMGSGVAGGGHLVEPQTGGGNDGQ